MSETFQHKVERLEHEPRLPSPEAHKALAEHIERQNQTEHDPAQAQEKARQVLEAATVEKQPDPLEQLASTEASAAPAPQYVNKELKDITLSRELKMIQRHLPAPQRALSRFVHKPAVKVASEALAGSVSRPSGLLGGGLVAFAGTSSYLYLAKHIGFTYNYSIALILFAAGFCFGVTLELLVFVALRNKHHSR